jgi:hypothetical protein
VKKLAALTLAVISAAPSAGCGADFLAVEVLPPRSTITCSAPGIKSSALSRGILDLEGTRDFHGAYVADLRVLSTRDAVLDAFQLTYHLPDGASSGSKDAADDASKDPAAGDVVLDSSDSDALRAAIVENATLIPRDLAIALRDDDGIEADEDRFATIGVDILPVVSVGDPPSQPSTFAIDVCRGCLVAEPKVDECENGFVETGVCRPGQDADLYTCAAAAPTGI